MPLTTSSQFASVIETGTDWRDTSKKILEKLESIRTENAHFNIGFLYVSDHLAEDLSSITNLFKSVLEIDNWFGSVGMGVCGNGIEHIDKVAISVMIGQFEENSFHFVKLPNVENDGETQNMASFDQWMNTHEPMLALTHANPLMADNPTDVLNEITEEVGGFIVGGLASSREKHAIIGPDGIDDDINCLVFSSDLPVATTLSQGCEKISPVQTITRCHKGKIYEIDGDPALDIFEQTLKVMTERETDIIRSDSDPKTAENLLQSEIHSAFPISGSDQGNYLVRHITGLEETEKSMEVAYGVKDGDHILFVSRNSKSVKADLSKQVLNIRERVQKDHGSFSPKGALYISCVARAFNSFHEDGDDGGEMALIQNIIGDVPLTGFYASGEINSGKLYSYTGILILFL